MTEMTLDNLRALCRQEPWNIGLDRGRPIQNRPICRMNRDRQWIHVDVERAEFITLFPLKSEFGAEVACTMFCNGLHPSLHIVRFQ